MIGFAVGFVAWLASTLVPAFVGLLTIVWAGQRIRATYALAFSLGIFLWFFVDTITGSATLDVNSGFTGGLAQIATIVLFLIGAILFLWLDRNHDIFRPESARWKYGLTIPVLVAIALGIHGLGEGASYGYTVYVTTSNSLLDAFGGVNAGVAYVLHKGLEPMMVGASYLAYVSWQSSKQTRRTKDVLLLALIFAVPSLIGNPVGYFIMGPATGYLTGLNTTYFYALGTGTSIYAIFRLVGPLFIEKETTGNHVPMKITISLILGIMSIYVAALFHS